MTLPHVTDTEHQTGLAIPLTNHSIPWKQQRLRSFLRSGEFREHYADHKGLQDHTCHRLDTYHKHCLRTFVCWVFRPVSTIILSSSLESCHEWNGRKNGVAEKWHQRNWIWRELCEGTSLKLQRPWSWDTILERRVLSNVHLAWTIVVQKLWQKLHLNEIARVFIRS